MNILKSVSYALLTIALSSSMAFAKEKKVKAENNPEYYREIINEYKSYLEKLPENVKKEVETFRMDIVKLNNIKKDKYKKLSQEAQALIKKQNKTKRKLPYSVKYLINDMQKNKIEEEKHLKNNELAN